MELARRLMTLLAAAAVAVASTATGAPPAAAASTVRVNTTLDETQAGNGTCSLREATLYANGTAEPDCASAAASGTTTIDVPAGVYILTGGPLSLTGNASISGAGAATTTISGGGVSQVLAVFSGARVSVSGVAVTGGQSGAACSGNMCVGLGLPVFGFPGGGIINNGTLTLTGVIVSGNRTGAGATNPTCSDNHGGCTAGDGGDGGGISNTGTLTIAGSTITGNSTGSGGAGNMGLPAGGGGGSGHGGNGGGISNTGTLTITNSTIAGNTTGVGGDGARGGDGVSGAIGGAGSNGGAAGSGGGIENTGQLVISGSTIAGNRTAAGGHGGNGGDIGAGPGPGSGGVGGQGGSGGGIDSSTDMTLSNSTIVGNVAATSGGPGSDGAPDGRLVGSTPPGNGGGIEQRAMGTTLTHVTIASNSAPGTGGGIDGHGGTITAANSIVASNAGSAPSQNCAGVVTDQGGNVEFGSSSCPGGFLRADPKLATLADNGGPTQTIALEPGSAAIHRVRTCVLSIDQRGAGRPVGAACDSGAYQVAPPSLRGISASVASTTNATISATVNPNVQDTTIVVNYGRTQGYGQSTAPRDLGAGDAAVPFTAALMGLEPGAIYHFDLVAKNADGTTTSSDGVFIALPRLTASIARASTTGPSLSLTIACGGGSGPGTCAGKIRLTSHVPTKRAHDGRAKRPKALTVASRSYSVRTGNQVTVRIKLNRQGRTLLAEHYTLASTVTLRGTTAESRRVTFRYPVIQSDVIFTFSFKGGPIVATQLDVTGIPRGGKVTVICHGGGCPFAAQGFRPRHGQVHAAPAFDHAALRLGASIQVEVAAANHVAKVETLTLRSGPAVTVTKQCLPPGAQRPARCVSKR